jgi:two-component system sensor histidine kinase BarA
MARIEPAPLMPIGQSSFRRLLLSRLLLVSVPVLLMGVYVTYRKARSAFLETARQNLAESAVRKADSLHQSIEALEANFLTASESGVWRNGSLAEQEKFLQQLVARFPNSINCLALIDIETGKQRFGRACHQRIADAVPSQLWPKQQSALLAMPGNLFVKNLLPPADRALLTNNHQLELLLALPIYDRQGQLKYRLALQTSLLYREAVPPGSLAGYPVVIAQNGTILAHPYVDRIGQNIDREADAERLKILMDNALQGRKDFLHLFSVSKNSTELVAGYSSLPSPITGESGQKWVILAVSPVATVLSPLRQIWEAIFYLIAALLLASLVAILLIARELARPLEQLRDYALDTDNIHSKKQIPRDFHIREINQLSTALEEMIEHLRAWGEEVVTSWKEAQNANRLKNEFLATTSHELRTPLNGIIGCIRCVKDGLCDSEAETQEFLQQADDAAVHLLGIINDILDIAKIEAGKQSVYPEPIDLHQIIVEIIHLQGRQIQSKGLELHLEESPRQLTIYADPAKFKQVLLNVISNATKFTDLGNRYLYPGGSRDHQGYRYGNRHSASATITTFSSFREDRRLDNA